MLDTLRRIVQEVNAAEDLGKALDVIVTRIKRALSVDVCSIYLSLPGQEQLVLMATDGLNPAAVLHVRLKFSEGLVGVVAQRAEPLNLKRFIYELDVPVIVGGCATYTAALHLMRTGAAGVLVGFGGGAAHTTRTTLGIHAPMATAVADVAAARRDYMDESGGRYVHVIADGGMRTGGDIAKAIACGADAVMLGSPLTTAKEAPAKGNHWGMATFHPTLPRGTRVKTGALGTLEEILVGPAHENDGRRNLFGALRASMATTGHASVKEFQKAEVMVAPALQTEGKALQKSQQVGMG